MRLRHLVHDLRHPRTTVRWRLTLLYGSLFLVSGAALLAVTYTLVEHATISNGGVARQIFTQRGPGVNFPPLPTQTVPRGHFVNGVAVPRAVRKLLTSKAGRSAITIVGSDQRISDLHQLVVESAIALAIMAVLSTALGWMVAGRALRPLRMMTATAQQISEANLHQRLAMRGPRDELRQLADTIDGLLARLEGAFDAQRRFVANASHELRTPLTAARAMLEMALSDPRATVEGFRTTCRQVLEESEHQEELIDALLALAQGQRGIGHSEPADLAQIADEVLQGHEVEAAARGIHLDISLAPATVSGDRRLIAQLTSNLVENALRHNDAGGSVWLGVERRSGAATLGIANTGPVVPAGEVERLLQPFQRLAGERVGHGDGLGLGLSIVAAVAAAHDATLEVSPRPGGGLEVAVRFPASPDEPPEPASQPEPVLSAD